MSHTPTVQQFSTRLQFKYKENQGRNIEKSFKSCPPATAGIWPLSSCFTQVPVNLWSLAVMLYILPLHPIIGHSMITLFICGHNPFCRHSAIITSTHSNIYGLMVSATAKDFLTASFAIYYSQNRRLCKTLLTLYSLVVQNIWPCKLHTDKSKENEIHNLKKFRFGLIYHVIM